MGAGLLGSVTSTLTMNDPPAKVPRPEFTVLSNSDVHKFTMVGKWYGLLVDKQSCTRAYCTDSEEDLTANGYPFYSPHYLEPCVECRWKTTSRKDARGIRPQTPAGDASHPKPEEFLK